MDFSTFFQIGPYPHNTISGTYSWPLIFLSYATASFASFVALDITERMRNAEVSSKFFWLVAGGLAMGMGIWTMHFIGMLAFIMPMPMTYDPLLTILSLIIAVVISIFAFSLIRENEVRMVPLVGGGVVLALGIVLMHYTGMSAMIGMDIHYVPSIFFLSIAIAIAASESALWLMIRKNTHNFIKIGSALVMGLAVCGMHYTGMAAAVFTPGPVHERVDENIFSPNSLSMFIALMSLSIITIALFASKTWANILLARNQKLMETEAILESKRQELLEANNSLELSIGRIQAILRAAGDGIIVADQKGNIEIINHAVEKIFEMPSKALLSQNIFKLIDQKKLKDRQGSVIEEGREALFEFILVHKDGKQIPLELNLSSSKINDELLYIIIIRDVTERKLNEERLNILNGKLLATARMAGMAEVATSVLHNVGNVLNSINVSTEVLLKRDSELGLRTEEFSEVVKLLSEHKVNNNLDTFLKNNRVGQILPEYLSQFVQYADREQNFSRKELESLNHKVLHIKKIVKMQQSLCTNSRSIETLNVNDLLEDALAINSEKLDAYKIKVKRDFQQIPSFEGEKVKLLQILINLIKNAAEALQESSNPEKILKIKTQNIDNFAHIAISDNGIGIDPENLTKIFSYGFTTKEEGNGIGLHSSAITIQQIGGSLKAFSQGKSKGAEFILTMPISKQGSLHV